MKPRSKRHSKHVFRGVDRKKGREAGVEEAKEGRWGVEERGEDEYG